MSAPSSTSGGPSYRNCGSIRGALAVAAHGHVRSLTLLVLLVALAVAGCAGGTATTTSSSATAPPRALIGTKLNGLRIEGNHFVGDGHRQLVLHGVFYSSFEWACSHRRGVSSQPFDPAAARRLLGWHVNFVRLGIPEDCWLGINGEPRGATASAYREGLLHWVNLLHRYGIYTEIGLMYAAPGSNPSIVQAPMPDEDHAPAFWKSFAAFFRHTPDLIFGLYGEPHPNMPSGSWACWLHGGSSCSVSYDGRPYVAAGMQQLVNLIRATGARQPISVSGIRAGADLSEWLQHEPRDPAHQLDAEWHEYGGSPCFTAQDIMIANDESCWNGVPARVAATVPVVNGEVGEHIGDDTCRWSFMPRYLAWAEAHDVSYAAWKFGVDLGTCVNMALIRDGAGDPTPIYGQRYRAWLAAH